MSALLAAWIDQLAQWEDRKLPLAEYATPCCAEPLFAPLPPRVKQFGNAGFAPPPVTSTQECPHCGEHFTKTVYASGVVMAKVEANVPRLGVVA